MIAYLNGVVTEKMIDRVVIDVSGIGYSVFVSGEDHGFLAIDKPAKVHIYEHIREQSYDLFGFTKVPAKRLFEQLLDVNGVGPKMALNMLSIGSSDNVARAIAEGNVKYLQAASGVGKRVAERVVVDLKDKVGLLASDSATTFLQDTVVDSDEAAQALVQLGFTPADAAAALRGIDAGLSTEHRVRQALKEQG